MVGNGMEQIRLFIKRNRKIIRDIGSIVSMILFIAALHLDKKINRVLFNSLNIIAVYIYGILVFNYNYKEAKKPLLLFIRIMFTISIYVGIIIALDRPDRRLDFIIRYLIFLIFATFTLPKLYKKT